MISILCFVSLLIRYIALERGWWLRSYQYLGAAKERGKSHGLD